MTEHGYVRSATPLHDVEHEPDRDGVYHHTCSHDIRLPLPNYAGVNVEAFDAHSVIVALSASNSNEGPPSVNIVGTLEEFVHQLKTYARLQAQQQEKVVEQK